jgi:PAS domain S-box-containing protein
MVDEPCRRNAEQIRSLVDAIPDIVIETDLTGTIAFANDAAARLGWSAEFATGRNLFSLLPPADASRAVDNARQMSVRAWDPHDYRLVSRDGTETTFEVNAKVLRRPDGTPRGMVFVLRDAMARKREEEVLRKSEERYRQLVESAHDWVWEVDAAAVYTFAGPQVESILGYTPQQVVGKRPFDLMPPEEASRVAAEFETIVSQRLPFWGLENINRHRDGQLVVLETNGVPIFDEHGNFCGYRGMDRDVTDRRRSREALRLSEEKFAKAFHASPDSVNINRLRDGLYVDINPGFTALTGYDREDVIGKSSVEIGLWADSRDRDRMVGALNRDGQVNKLEAKFRLKDGSVRLGQMSARVITLADEPHIISITRDIHEAKRAEEALQESEKRFRRITENMTDLVAEVDSNIRYRYVSPSVRTMLGMDPESLIGTWAFERIHPDDLPAVQQAYAAALADGIPRRVEFRYRHAEGHCLWFQALGRILYDANGAPDGFTVVSRDITDRKQSEEERAKLQEKLTQAQKMEAVGRLAGGIAHDFNNLLTVILGHVGFVLDDIKSNDRVRADLMAIQQAAERAAALTGQLLAFSRKTIARPQVMRLGSVIKNVENLLRRLLGEDIDLQITNNAEGNVYADPSQMEQVVMNLAVNARDAMPNGGQLKITIADRQLGEKHDPEWIALTPGPYVSLAVSDTGCGMDSATLSRVFEPFFTTKEPGKGTGLGLSTVHGIISQARGQISVTSRLGAGTSFNLLIPAITESAGAMAAQTSPSGTKNGTETILLVEDDDAVRRLSASVLRRQGYTVVEATNGRNALMVINTPEPAIDLIVSDLVMPGMGGMEMCEQARRLRPGIKVLFLSGYTEDSSARRSAALGAVPFLQKPYLPHVLIEKVRDVLDAANE